MNPFVINGIVPDKYFCDRKAETERITRALLDRTNILLTSPRRMGKTQLIRHIYNQPEVKNSFYTFYTDIYATTSLHEFVVYISKEVYSRLVPAGKKVLDSFISIVKSLYGCFTYNPGEYAPSFEIKLGDIRSPELTLSEIFDFLEKADKPCIFAIDEFQRIGDYPQKNVEALLRSYIQKINNCSFIFAGSNRHILDNMFNSSAKPFYNSAKEFHLDCIDRDIYVSFIENSFAENGRKIDHDAACLAYDQFSGHTYYVHSLMHDVFTYMDPTKVADTECIKKTLDEILEEKSHSFADQMSLLNYQQKETLIAIAKEGKASGVTSVGFVRKHSLQSPSSVQNAIRNLLEKDMITYDVEGRIKTYSVCDRFLELWLRITY